MTTEKDGETWFFEIKTTRHEDRYVGATPQMEWHKAFKDPAHFRFVVLIVDDKGRALPLPRVLPAEFMEFSTIPPFKVYINIDFTLWGSRERDLRVRKRRSP